MWEGIHNGEKVCIKCLRITKQSCKAVEKVHIFFFSFSVRVLGHYLLKASVGTQGFCKEAVMWKRLRHPNIVAFIGVMQNPLQFVSEWMPNGTLTEYLAENPDTNRTRLVTHFSLLATPD